ncbi:MAG TPA: enoyl-CoA hydratase/isomerase family protein [Gemmatimonadales bacterium]|nr:enoyl-CoA hydratase/isomerase family protein [Gemmatimonadales bacterium]
MTEPVVASLERGILSLTLNRAEKRNALNAASVELLHQSLEQADLDADVRVVLIRGAGKDFCAGADLDELLASADQTPDQNEASAYRLGQIFERIRSLPKPVVALVQGRALAGGAGLATACDLVLAGDNAQLGYPEIQRGFVPAMVATLLHRTTGEKMALDLVLTGRLLGAEEARAAGLITRVVPAAALQSEGTELALRLANSSATALALTKRVLFEQEGKSFSEGIRLGAKVNALARSTPDFRTSIASFLKA